MATIKSVRRKFACGGIPHIDWTRGVASGTPSLSRGLGLVCAAMSIGSAIGAPVVSSSGVRTELGAGVSPLFESVGQGADALPLDWPAAAVKVVVTTGRNGKTNVIEITDPSVATLTVVAPTSSRDEAQVTLTVEYQDEQGIARRTDRAVVYAVRGLNGAEGNFSSAAVGSSAWGKFTEKTPVIPVLSSGDTVARNGEAVGETGSWYRQLPKETKGVSVTYVRNTAEEDAADTVTLLRDGPGLALILR